VWGGVVGPLYLLSMVYTYILRMLIKYE